MSKKNPPKNKSVSLVQDPFQLKTLEIGEAQNDSGELDLDEGLGEEIEIADLDEKSLDSLAKAVAREDAKSAKNAEKLAGESAESMAEILALQIAEDQALARSLAAEQQALDENQDPELKAALPNLGMSAEMDQAEMQSCIEALLFMCDKPVSATKLREMIGPDFPLSIFQEALTSLKDSYQGTHHGIELVEVAGGYQFRTKPGRAALSKKLAKIQAQRLSSGAMESLAIIAYKQPVMKEDIDKIRGVDSSYFIRGLLDKKLIRITGRSELPGRPMLYSTTQEFMEVFGLKDLSSMPPLHELEQMVPGSQAINEEDPRVKEMRRLVGQMNTDESTNLIYDPREDEKLLSEIRERVSAIPVSTPYLEQQKELEKRASELAIVQATQLEQPDLPDAR